MKFTPSLLLIVLIPSLFWISIGAVGCDTHDEPEVKNYPYVRFLNACPNCSRSPEDFVVTLHYVDLPNNISRASFNANVLAKFDEAGLEDEKDELLEYYDENLEYQEGTWVVDEQASKFTLVPGLTPAEENDLVVLFDLIDYFNRPYFQSAFGDPSYWYSGSTVGSDPIPFPEAEYGPVQVKYFYGSEDDDYEIITKTEFPMNAGENYTLVLAGTYNNLTQHVLTVQAFSYGLTQKAPENKSRIRFYSFLPDLSLPIRVICQGCADNGEDLVMENIGYGVGGGSGYSSVLPTGTVEPGKLLARIFNDGKWQTIYENTQTLQFNSGKNYSIVFVGYSYTGVDSDYPDLSTRMYFLQDN